MAALMQAYRNTMFLLYGNQNFTKAAFLKHQKNFDAEVEPDKDMTGKTCIVTGGNAGIGKAAAEGLARRGATICLVCRNREKGEEAASQIREATGNESVSVQICDLSSMAQVRALAEAFRSKDQRVDVLINNAGIMEQKHENTPEGLETNFAVNVMGTFLLSELLLPCLRRASPDAKVITVATGGVLTQPLSTDLQMERVKFDGTEAYARNKRVQLALTEKWAELYGAQGRQTTASSSSSSSSVAASGGPVESNPPGQTEEQVGSVAFVSMHPGWVDTDTLRISMPGFYKTFQSSLRSPLQGADTIVWLSSQPAASLKPGAFYFDRKEVPKHLPLAGTGHSAADVDDIYTTMQQLAGLNKG